MKISILALVASTFFSLAPVYGEQNSSDVKLKIKEVDLSRKKAAAGVEGDPTSIKPGQSFVKGGSDCRAQVTKIKGNIVQLDLGDCRSIEKLEAGQSFEPSLIETEAPQPSEPRRVYKYEDEEHGDGANKIFAKFYISGANNIRSTDIKQNTPTSQNLDGSFNSNGAVGISVELFHVPKNSWGFDAGLEFDSKRDISSSAIIPFGSSKPSFSVGDIYGNAIYRWHNFYLPFGLNWSYISATNFNDGSSFNGTLGAQLGVGWLINQFAIEIESRALQFRGTFNDGTTSGDYGSLYLAGIQLNLKYGWDL